MSVRWYSAASESGESEADMALSKWFLCGSGGAALSSSSSSSTSALAEGGASDQGGFEKDESLALLFAEKAARKGLASAEFAMGYYAEVGVGQTRDLGKARGWYELVSFFFAFVRLGIILLSLFLRVFCVMFFPLFLLWMMIILCYYGFLFFAMDRFISLLFFLLCFHLFLSSSSLSLPPLTPPLHTHTGKSPRQHRRIRAPRSAIRTFPIDAHPRRARHAHRDEACASQDVGCAESGDGAVESAVGGEDVS